MTRTGDEVDQRRRRAFLVAVTAGALAVVLVAVLGVIVLMREWEKRSVDPFSQAHRKYHRLYVGCVARGDRRSICARRIESRCVDDPIFKHDENAVSDISLVCSALRHN